MANREKLLCHQVESYCKMDDDILPRMKNLFQQIAKSMEEELEEARATHSHSTLTGEDAEDTLRDFLRSYLPARYGFANGQIIDSHGNQSKEVDIAICNQGHPFTYADGGRGLLFIEGVDAVIESKATLSNVDEVIENCKSIRPPDLISETAIGTIVIAGNEHHEPSERTNITPYALFAFDSNYSLTGIRDKLEEAEQTLSEDQTIDIVCVLGRGVIVRNRPYDRLHISDDSSSEYKIIVTDSELIYFLLYLHDKMPKALFSGYFLQNYIESG